jgi:hypothetical protein
MRLHDAWHIRLAAEREAKIRSLEAEVAHLLEVISRAASHWIHLDPGVAWEGDVADAMAAALAEIERLRLTDEERYAVRYMIAAGKFGQRDEALTEEHAATLRGLLERRK